jgi:outer membrane immunogenic protein
MKKQFASILGAIILTVASGNASAADADMAPAPYDWSGPYVGLQAGYAFGQTEMYDSDETTGDFDLDGALLGATLGWNHQANNLVIGLEGDVSWSHVEGNLASALCGTGCDIDLGWLATARLRAGYAFDNALIFAAGGLAAGVVEMDVDTDYTSGTDTRFGWTIGAGAELAVSEALTVKVEYLYVDLGDMETPASGGPMTTDVGENHIIRAGLNWQF